MRYLDVCAGISASTVAWKPLGWEAAAYSEIEAAPRAILAHHYPDTPLHGDFTTIAGDDYGPIDLLVGGTPCQDFSVAGLRAGLDGDRGNLSLEFLRLADRARPRWVVWENVPGVLSIDGGRAFGAILGGLGELGYGFAYRVLDAQFFGVPQRRRRVFVVGCAGDWRRAAAVLSERHSLSGHPAPRRAPGEAASGRAAWGIDSDCLDRSGEGVAGTAAQRAGLGIAEQVSSSLRAKRPNAVAYGGGNTSGSIPVAAALAAHGRRQDFEVETFVTQPIPTCYDTTHITSPGNWSNPQPDDPCHPLTATAHVPLLAPSPLAFDCKAGGDTSFAISEIAGSLRGAGHGGGHAAVAFTIHGTDGTASTATETSVAGSLRTKPPGSIENSSTTVALHHHAVRRLTPRECERLQGFPDHYTLVPHRGKPMADGPRYKALGNSMAVPVMRWIGERIAAVEALTDRAAA